MTNIPKKSDILEGMKKTMLVVAVLVLFPGLLAAQTDDWDKTEQEFNVQLDKLDADLKLFDEQLNIEEPVEATTEGTFIQQNGQMVQIMSEKSVITRLINMGVISQTDVRKEGQAVSLIEENKVMMYEVVGMLQQKLLGIWPVKIEKKVVVNAKTGEVVRQEVSLGMRILDWLAF
jgi:hypothetical protein